MKKLILFATVLVGLALLGYQFRSTSKIVEASQCKVENAECEINNSEKTCCAGLTCVLFNAQSGNHKCELASTSPSSSPSTSPSSSPSSSPSTSPSASPSASPSTSPSSSPSSSPSTSPSASPSTSPSSSPSASPSVEPSDDPEESESPEATPTDNGDICDNIDGIQTGIPEGQHLDASGLNCVNFELGGAPVSEGTSSTGEVLGTSTGQVLGSSIMAGTGVAEETLFNFVFTIGSLLSAFGIRKFASSRVK